MRTQKWAQWILIVFLVLAALFLPSSQPARAGGPVEGVILIGSQEYPSLEAAVAAANPGDTLLLSGGDMVLSQMVTIPQNSNLTLDLGQKALISRIDVRGGRMLRVVNGGSFTLKNGFLRAEDVNDDGFSGGALASFGTNLTLDKIRAEGFHASDNGAVVNVQVGNQEIIITNSVFERNSVISTWSSSSMSGGAIEIYSSSSTGRVRVAGNRIANNSVTGGYYSYGGGITLRGGGQFEFTDNVVDNNQTTAQTLLHNNYWSHGGGMAILSAVSSSRPMHMVLEGNTISNNNTQLYGGGIYFLMDKNSNDILDLLSGSFLGNHSNFAGGAIDFSVHGQPTLVMDRVLMTGNTARAGGGIWACPTARVQSFSTLGGAITGNALYQNPSGSAYRPSGHDVRFEGWDTQIPGILTDNDPLKHMLTVRQRTYLGDALTWYLDNPGQLYQPGDLPLDTESLTDNPDTQGLISQLDAGADWLTPYLEAAALVFMNNTANYRGGAISTNSDIQIGLPTDLSVTVTKAWLDETGAPLTLGLPARVEVQLRAKDEKGGIHPLETVPLNAENGWSHTFSQLPSQLFVKGEVLALRYEVVEITPLSDFEVAYGPLEQTGEQAFAVAITNQKVASISIPVQKIWTDGDNQDGLRPASITVRLQADGVDTDHTLTLSPGSGWTGSFVGLPLTQGGVPIAYTVREEGLPTGYVAVYTGSVESGFTITNTHQPEQVSLSGSKTWDDAQNQAGQRPESITVHLLKNNVVIQSITVTAREAWAWNFGSLPLYENGQEVVYTIREDRVPGYESTVSGLDITNHYPPVPAVIHVPLKVRKELINGVLKEGQFTFQLKDRQGTVIAQANNAADGSITFPDRTFSQEVSNWVYTIHEVAGAEEGVIYDKTVYTVIVNVSLVEGRLEARVDIQKNGTPFAGEMTFVNHMPLPGTGDLQFGQITLLFSLAVILGIATVFIRRRKRI